MEKSNEIIEFIDDCNAYFSSNTQETQNIDEWIEKNTDAILSYARQNDVSVYDMNLSARAFNLLKLNNCLFLSQIIFKTNDELNEICFGNKNDAAEITLYIREWLFANRGNISALSNGETESVEEKNGCARVMLQDFEDDVKRENYIQYAKQHDMPIELLELSVRSTNALRNKNIKMFSEVVALYPYEYGRIKNLGSKSIIEIQNRVEQYFLTHSNSFENAVDEMVKNFDYEALTAIELFNDPHSKDKAWEYIKKNDIEIASMNFSNRSRHALLDVGINTFSSLLEIYPIGIFKIKNLGIKSIDEIKSIVQSKAEQIKPLIVAYCKGETQLLISDDFIEETVLEQFTDKAFTGISFKEIKEKFSEDIDEKRIKKAIGKLIRTGVLEYVDFRCYRVYKSFFDVLNENAEYNSKANYLLRRCNGETLETIAQSENLTRERIRQICKNQYQKIKNAYYVETGLDYFDEDYYKYLFETYEVNKDFLQNYLNLQIRTISYLKNTCKLGSTSLDDAINDSKLDLNLRLRIRAYLDRDKIEIDQILMEQSRAVIEDYVLEKYCQDELKYDDFIWLYNDVLTKNNIVNKKLFIYDEVLSSRSNRFFDSRICLWKQGERLRYYDIDSRDYTELLETINLEEYSNIEISTLKFMEDYPDIMEKYDIRDQYELHNLLKKIIGNNSEKEICFGRQPIISFGESNRVDLYLKILNIVAPVTLDEFAEYIHMENGFDKKTVMSSPEIQQLSQYYHDGLYVIDFKRLPDNHATALSSLLTEDFYYIDEIVKIYDKNFPGADLDCINPRSLKTIGFNVFSKYAIKNYSTAEAYFKTILTKEDIFDMSQYRSRYGTMRMFNSIVQNLKKAYEIIQFDKDKYINFRRLAKVGVTKKMLEDFCNDVNDFVQPNTYFTIQSLQNEGFNSDLDDLGFDEVFYSGILAASPLFSYQSVYSTIVLYSGNDNKQFSIKAFLQNLLRQYDGIDIDDFAEDVFENYGIKIPNKYDITAAVAGTEMYYDSIMNKIYPNKDKYYSDLDD